MPMNLSLGIGIGHNGGPIFDPDARAWFAAMPTQPNATVQSILNNFVVGLKADGLWSLIDGGNFLCLETLAQGLVDFKVPSRVATTAPGFTSVFTSYRGVTGSGSASQDAYIDTGFIPSTAGGVFTQDSAHIAGHTTNNITNSIAFIGVNAAQDMWVCPREVGNFFTCRSNNSTNTTLSSSITDSRGLTILSRTGATNTDGYLAGSLVGSNANASLANPNASIRYLQIQANNASLRQITFGCYGGGLNATQADNLNTRVQTAVTALRVL